MLFLSSGAHVPGIVNVLESSVEVAAWIDFGWHVGLILMIFVTQIGVHMSRRISDRLSGYYQLLPLFNLTHVFCLPLKTLAQGGLQNEGHAETPDFPVSMSSSCLCPGKSVIQALLYSLSSVAE